MLTIELRGSELADSPLQRESNLRNVPLARLTVADLRVLLLEAGRKDRAC